TNFASVSKDEKHKNIAIVFLSGTSGSPQSHKLLLETMIKNGFHVIALDYPNKYSVGSIAKNNLDEWENIREEIVTGNDKTPLLNINKENAVIPLLNSVIKYLSEKEPEENWSQYLNGNEVNWSKIITSGYSQGAGHAGYIASKYNVYGSILFSGPVDGRIEKPFESANWIKKDWKTDKSKIHIMVSKNDIFYNQIKENINKIIITPTENNFIMTDDTPQNIAHFSTSEDASTPLNINKTPIYKDKWEKLMVFN
ncbi:MAG: BPSS1187 family protein, partial [Candidatus Sericytochromatia bacterium]